MEKTICKIKFPSVFMHTSPDISSETSDELLYGTPVKRIGTSGDYVRCETEYGYSGYVHRRYISSEEEKQSSAVFVVKSIFADILPEPVYKYRPIITVPCGSLVYSEKKAEAYGSFIAVEHRGHKCYIPSGCVSVYGKITETVTENAETLRKMICDDALMYLGTPYRWGGKSTAGIDCSGLCFMAYYLNGLPLWRDSFADTRFVHEVSAERVRQGDVVYFKGHAGIYIGDGEYVHASSLSGRVTVNSLHKNSIIYRGDIAERFVCFARSNLL